MNEELDLDPLNPPSTDYFYDRTQNEQSTLCYANAVFTSAVGSCNLLHKGAFL